MSLKASASAFVPSKAPTAKAESQLKIGREFVPKAMRDTQQEPVPVAAAEIPTVQELTQAIPAPLLTAMYQANAGGSALPPPLLFKAPENVAPPPPKKIQLHAKYKNPVEIKQLDAEEIKKQEDDIIESNKKGREVNVIDLSAFNSLKDQCKRRPQGMMELKLPHSSKKFKGTFNFRKNPDSKFSQFNENVMKIREYLNKLTNVNAKQIEQALLNRFQYTAQLLKQLSKMVFLKATTEQNYIELYVDLCEALFKKFNDKQNIEMNFKKLLLRKSQKVFYKEKYSDNEEDFSKGTLLVFDTEEIMHRKKMRTFGNMKLIGELFCRGHVSDKVISQCFIILTETVDDETVESLCYFLEKVAVYTIKRQKKKGLLTLEYIKQVFEDLIALSKDKRLSSRVRFRILDFKDMWDNKLQHQYEKKLSLLKGAQEESSDSEEAPIEVPVTQAPPSEDEKEDADAEKEVIRKMSMNEHNVTGLNFQRYEAVKPSHSIRLKIQNCMIEFSEHKDADLTFQTFSDHREDNKDIPALVWLGYMLMNGFSRDPSGFNDAVNLMLMFHERGSVTKEDLKEGFHFSMQNLLDTLIDYPNSKEYMFQLLDKYEELGIIEDPALYKEHIEKIENGDYEDIDDE